MPDKPKKETFIGPMKEGAAELKKEFDEAAIDFSKSLTKQIKKANISGASHFRMEFLKAAQASQGDVVKNFEELQKAGFGDIAKAYTEALQGAQQGLISPTEFESIGNKFVKAIEGKFPGLAADLVEDIENAVGNMQLDKMQTDMKSAISSGVTGAFDMIPKNAFTKAIGIDFAMQAASEAVGGMIGDKVGKAFRKVPWQKMIGIGVALGLAFGVASFLITGMREATDTIGKEFGAIGVQQFKSDLLAAKSEAMELGQGFEEVAASSKVISQQFGIGFKDAIKMSTATIDTAVALGISTDNAAQLTGMLMTMGGHSSRTAINLMKQTHALAESVGLAPGVVLEDMAGSSEEIALFTKDGGINMGLAAVQARRMGLSLSTASKMAEGLLEFESSLTAELEASVLIGRQVNLQKARELALAGDLEQMQNEILNIVGSETEFNQLNMIQRKALAGALSLEVSELAKMVKFSGKSADELARMGEFDVSKIVGKEAISNISLFVFWVKSLGTWILAGVANLSTFFGLIDSSAPSGLKMFGALAAIIAVMAITFKLAGIAIGFFAKGLTSAVGPLAALGTVGTIAVPILVAIGLVGLTIVGVIFGIAKVMEMIPPIIDSVSNAFVDIISTISELGPESIFGIIGLGLALYSLAGALSAIGAAGLLALPVMAAVGGMAALGGAIGGAIGGTRGEAFEDTEEGKLLTDINNKLGYLVKGFGGQVDTGVYATKIGTEAGRGASKGWGRVVNRSGG